MKEEKIEEQIERIISSHSGNINFQYIYKALLESQIISEGREDLKQVISIMRKVKVDGETAGLYICPLNKKEK
jgi:hypothetical protein